MWPCRQPWTGQAGHPTQDLPLTDPLPRAGWQYLLAAAAGPADVAEELQRLLGGHAGGGRGGGGGVTGRWPGCEGISAKGPAVTALQDGDLQGAPGTPHLCQEQEQSYHQLDAHGGPAPVLKTSERGLIGPPTAPFTDGGTEALSCLRIVQAHPAGKHCSQDLKPGPPKSKARSTPSSYT